MDLRSISLQKYFFLAIDRQNWYKYLNLIISINLDEWKNFIRDMFHEFFLWKMTHKINTKKYTLLHQKKTIIFNELYI